MCARWALVAAGVVSAVLLGRPAVARPPHGTAPADAASPIVSNLLACLAREDVACAEAHLAALRAQLPASTTVEWFQGSVDFLAGRWGPARVALQRVAGSPLVPDGLRDRAQALLKLVDANDAVLADTKPHLLAAGRVQVWLRPGADEVLLPYLERVLERALPALELAFGPVARKAPIVMPIVARAADLGRITGLTVEQIRTSGTIAVCKHDRVMLTSPQDLVFGYPWADTVTHELVHWFVIKHGGAGVPVWLHEGLARAFQGVWRAADPADLDIDERRTLATARARGRFIALDKMSPSMALLPSQEETQLAFAEVHSAAVWLLQHAPLGSADPLAARAGQLVNLFGSGLGESAVIAAMTGSSAAVFRSRWRRDLLRLDLRLPPAAEGPAAPNAALVFRGVGAHGLTRLTDEARRFAELGDRLAVADRPAAAAIEYRKALAAGAGSGGALVSARLVRALLDIGRNEEADQWLSPALQQHADHAPLHVLAARAALAQGRPQEALQSVERAAWINPFDPQVHELAAQAWSTLGNEKQAAAARANAQRVTGGAANP